MHLLVVIPLETVQTARLSVTPGFDGEEARKPEIRTPKVSFRLK